MEFQKHHRAYSMGKSAGKAITGCFAGIESD
jgi:hypothetical protein